MSRLDYFSALVRLLPDALALCAMQALPPLTYGLVSRRMPWRGRIASGIALAGLLGAWWLSADGVTGQIAGLFLGLAYFSLSAAATYGLSRSPVRAYVTRGAMVLFCAFAFVLAPALVLSGRARVLVLLWGWEMMLAAYSFWADAPLKEGAPSLGGGVFFIAINPCLVFGRRGKIIGVPALRGKGLLRLALGVGAILSHIAVIAAWRSRLNYMDLAQVTSLATYGSFSLYLSVRAVEIYFAHSGCASIHIGLFRLLGYELPERYRLPFLAKSPTEFWRRWNLYIAEWFKHYVFNPAALRGVRSGRLRPPAAKAAGLVLAFAGCGIAHEYVTYLKAFSVGLGLLLAFLLQAGALLLWLAVEAGVGRLSVTVPWLRRRPALVVGSWISRVLFSQLLLVTLWLVIPALSGWGLPPLVRGFLSSHMGLQFQ